MPTNGPAEPTSRAPHPAFPAALPRARSKLITLVDAHLNAVYASGPGFRTSASTRSSRHEQAAMDASVGRVRTIEVLDATAGQNACRSGPIDLRVRANSKIFLVDGDRPDPTEQTPSPSIHRVHDPVSPPKQRDQRHVRGGGQPEVRIEPFRPDSSVSILSRRSLPNVSRPQWRCRFPNHR